MNQIYFSFAIQVLHWESNSEGMLNGHTAFIRISIWWRVSKECQYDFRRKRLLNYTSSAPLKRKECLSKIFVHPWICHQLKSANLIYKCEKWNRGRSLLSWNVVSLPLSTRLGKSWWCEFFSSGFISLPTNSQKIKYRFHNLHTCNWFVKWLLTVL